MVAASRPERLNALGEHAQDILQAARDAAATSRGYNSTQTRLSMTADFRRHFDSDPYTWQLDASEAFLLKVDGIFLAGTGSGKTIPMMLPLFVSVGKWVLILSPLKVLQQDQRRRFKKAGIKALVVNGDTWNAELERELYLYSAQAIFTSPEMCLKHPAFRKWLKSEQAQKSMLGTNVDEVHCIPQWSADFRKDYGQIDALRSLFPLGTPMHGYSATLEPDAVYSVSTSLKIDLSNAFFLNLGNDRPNITPSVVLMKNAEDFSALHPLLPAPDILDTAEKLPKTIIFVNTIKFTHRICWFLRRFYGERFNSAFAPFHAHRTAAAKDLVTRQFRRGEIRVLVSTEAFGMGADIPDVEQVFQFGFPQTLSMWVQRAGRAGRSRGIQSRAVLLAEASAFKRRKPRTSKRKSGEENLTSDEDTSGSEDEDEDVETEEDNIGDGRTWSKNIDPSLRLYCSTDGCRRDVTDNYFNNPPRAPPTGICCDRCDGSAPSIAGDDTNMDIDASRPNTPTADSSPPGSVHSSPSKEKNKNGKRRMERVVGGATRTGGRREAARSALEKWRYQRALQSPYRDSSLSPSTLLPDSTLTTLAYNARIKTVEDITKYIINPPWLFASQHGAEVLECLFAVDIADRDARQAKTLANREAKKQATRERNEQKKQKKQNEAKQRRQARAALKNISNTSIMTTPPRTFVPPLPPTPGSPVDLSPITYNNPFTPAPSVNSTPNVRWRLPSTPATFTPTR